MNMVHVYKWSVFGPLDRWVVGVLLIGAVDNCPISYPKS